MNVETGEIKKFDKEPENEENTTEKEPEVKKQFHKIPKEWVGLPMPGWEVEVVSPPNNRRGRKWKVVEIIEGKPGRMVLEPSIKTIQKGKKHL